MDIKKCFDALWAAMLNRAAIDYIGGSESDRDKILEELQSLGDRGAKLANRLRYHEAEVKEVLDACISRK